MHVLPFHQSMRHGRTLLNMLLLCVYLCRCDAVSWHSKKDITLPKKGSFVSAGRSPPGLAKTPLSALGLKPHNPAEILLNQTGSGWLFFSVGKISHSQKLLFIVSRNVHSLAKLESFKEQKVLNILPLVPFPFQVPCCSLFYNILFLWLISNGASQMMRAVRVRKVRVLL